MREACRRNIFELFFYPLVVPVSGQVSRICSHPTAGQRTAGQAEGRTWVSHDIPELLFCEIVISGLFKPVSARGFCYL